MVEMSKQDVEALQEKMKNMSPEELKQLQKEQCIFCHIVSGKVASKKVYEDEHCIAILDINPANPGHVLIIPKEHYSIMPLIPDEIIQHLGMVAKAMSHALLKALKLEGTTIFIANGTVAGQRAQHFMIHVIPRREGDGIGLMIPKKKIAGNVFNELQKRIKSKANELFGIKEEKETEKEVKKQEEGKTGKKESKKAEKKTEKKSKKKKEEEKEEKEQEEEKEEKEQEEEKEEKEQEEEKEEDVSLDDIARLLK